MDPKPPRSTTDAVKAAELLQEIQDHFLTPFLVPDVLAAQLQTRTFSVPNKDIPVFKNSYQVHRALRGAGYRYKTGDGWYDWMHHYLGRTQAEAIWRLKRLGKFPDILKQMVEGDRA